MESQHDMNKWQKCICEWYPKYEAKAYFVPPVVITRMPFCTAKIAGQRVLVAQSNPAQDSTVQTELPKVKDQISQVSDAREDMALQQTLLCLRELADKEPMFVISQLQFSNYLREPAYEATAKLFSRPYSLSDKYRRGDFDILVIHRHCGIFTGEIKAVLSKEIPQYRINKAVADRVKNAIEQLDKSEIVLREITKDLEPNLDIRKILILPYVTAEILKGVVSSDEQLKQNLTRCLQVADFSQVPERCLLAENLAINGNEMVNVQQLQRWWSTFTADRTNTLMNSDTYLNLLARFCGPATTISVYCPTSPRIEVRTEGQGVAVTGKRMTSLVLTPEQIKLLTNPPAKVMLTGPPGVGKSVMLVLMALKWLSQGHDVQLVSVWNSSLAVTLMLKDMIQKSKCAEPITSSKMGNTQFREYDFYSNEEDVDKAINTLKSLKGSEGPYIICDEFFYYG